jgi:hypothetical protein
MTWTADQSFAMALFTGEVCAALSGVYLGTTPSAIWQDAILAGCHPGILPQEELHVARGGWQLHSIEEGGRAAVFKKRRGFELLRTEEKWNGTHASRCSLDGWSAGR